MKCSDLAASAGATKEQAGSDHTVRRKELKDAGSVLTIDILH
jgi:hypothetical protein